ncbi:MAG: hypothetical protein ABI955_12370, partial [Nitrospirota bacterium]
QLDRGKLREAERHVDERYLGFVAHLLPRSRMLKNFFRLVLASLRGSTYGLGKRLFRQAVGGRVNTVNASPLRSLRPR